MRGGAGSSGPSAAGDAGAGNGAGGPRGQFPHRAALLGGRELAADTALLFMTAEQGLHAVLQRSYPNPKRLRLPFGSGESPERLRLPFGSRGGSDDLLTFSSSTELPSKLVLIVW